MAPRIELTTGHPLEQSARDQLQRLLERYDLSRWQFTDVVHIQNLVVPHSHPVLTLNTAWLDDDYCALTSYLHEQLHWFLSDWEMEHPNQAQSAERELREHYPGVPGPEYGGAQDEASTYLHLCVCALEYNALSGLIGEERAAGTFSHLPFYGWVYETVLGDWEYFNDFLARYALGV